VDGRRPKISSEKCREKKKKGVWVKDVEWHCYMESYSGKKSIVKGENFSGEGIDPAKFPHSKNGFHEKKREGFSRHLLAAKHGKKTGEEQTTTENQTQGREAGTRMQKEGIRRVWGGGRGVLSIKRMETKTNIKRGVYAKQSEKRPIKRVRVKIGWEQKAERVLDWGFHDAVPWGSGLEFLGDLRK